MLKDPLPVELSWNEGGMQDRVFWINPQNYFSWLPVIILEPASIIIGQLMQRFATA
jgi:hypothetical protein